MRFKKGDWVQSARVGPKGPFVGQITDVLRDEYVIRDSERRKWLRTEGELSPPEKDAA